MPKRWRAVQLQSESESSDGSKEWVIVVTEKEKGFSHRLPSRFSDRASAKVEIREWKEAEEED
ncbi:hypothetical protein BH24ACT26_BH24ACT26_12860 [soil metagenome]